jgi:hypothetical protein
MLRRLFVASLVLCASVLGAQEKNIALRIERIDAPTIDGDIGEAAWQKAYRVDQWYETNPGDNIEPKVKSVAWLGYDDRFLYAAFEFFDPQPNGIRSAYGDHDQLGGNTDDYGGIIVDTRNDRKSAVLLLTNARGIQYDAISDDSSGEDSSPDFYWDSASRITDKGWTLEMRVPFSSLRYKDGQGPQEWGILLYRNWPRERRYQMFSGRLPRGGNCFICHRHPLLGLNDLPSGGHLVTAPYVTTRKVGETLDGIGTPWVDRSIGGDAGLDLKWTPNADTAVDATLNPDFSQVEADVAVISTNERFAINYPEKRPFFLEGIELFSTPIQAAYTRTITSPRWGLRSTGKQGANAYTVLVTQDQGGGTIILPGRFGSDSADQDFRSTAVIGRVRRDYGTSFISGIVTARENEGGSYNRVIGPDFRLQLGENDTITGQVLYSSTQNPTRAELSDQFQGQKLNSHAATVWWSRNTKTFDFFSEVKDFGDNFRADNGFVPQVGFRMNYSEAGYTVRPSSGFFNRLRSFAFGEYDEDQDGRILYRLASAGIGADGKYRSFSRLRFARDSVRTFDPLAKQDVVLDRNRLYYTFELSPTAKIARVTVNGWVGDEIDFSFARRGRGANIELGGTLRPTNHLQIGLTTSTRWLNLNSDRLFTSQVERIRTQYTFNSRMFVRAIVQNARTNRDVPLYNFDAVQHSGSLASQLLFAYKLNWQTVMYLGFGDLREITADQGEFEESERQFFMKLSYAWQK